MIEKLAQNKNDEEARGYICSLMSKCSKSNKTTVISHESLFDHIESLIEMINISLDYFDQALVVGYSRRQSDITVSAFSQWFFRFRPGNRRIHEILNQNSLTPSLFLGLEQFLISLIYSDFELYNTCQWYEKYLRVENAFHNRPVKILADTMPQRNSQKTLFEDFLEKAELTIKPNRVEILQAKNKNLSFNQDLIEVIYNMVSTDSYTGGPHSRNELLESISAQLTPSSIYNTPFIARLKQYVDAYYRESNEKFCEHFSVAQRALFDVKENITKAQIIALIVEEHQARLSNSKEVITTYRNLSGRILEVLVGRE
jgi:hypothetical protein